MEYKEILGLMIGFGLMSLLVSSSVVMVLRAILEFRELTRR